MDLDVFHPFPTQLTIVEGRSGNGGGENVLRKGHIHKDGGGRTLVQGQSNLNLLFRF